MADLEYRIGCLEIDPRVLKIEDFGDYPLSSAGYLSHKFVVECEDNLLLIYVAPGAKTGHEGVAKKFNVEGWLVGGGSCYLNNENELVLGGSSGEYGAIPKKVAQRFAELMKPELEKLRVEVKRTVGNQGLDVKSHWWEELGFTVTFPD